MALGTAMDTIIKACSERHVLCLLPDEGFKGWGLILYLEDLHSEEATSIQS